MNKLKSGDWVAIFISVIAATFAVVCVVRMCAIVVQSLLANGETLKAVFVVFLIPAACVTTWAVHRLSELLDGICGRTDRSGLVEMVSVNCKSCMGTGDAKNGTGSNYTSYSSPCCNCDGSGKVQVPLSSLG